MSIGLLSRGIARIPFLADLLGEPTVFMKLWPTHPAPERIAGWGKRPSTRKARHYASRRELPYLALEDGFLRSFGTGEHFPPLSIVQDEYSIYYDCTTVSGLERLLASNIDLLQPSASTVDAMRKRLLGSRLSKYNHAPDLNADTLRKSDERRILVVDQTAGDMSVALGAASAETFKAMLTAALEENPRATVYVKTHPEVSANRKSGYLTWVEPSGRVVLLRDIVNPLSLMETMDRVYVVSSTMGFEALLAGKPVTCFGVPWYAGWGVTDDRQPNHPAIVRRAHASRTRSVNDLFAAAYLHYSQYLDPQSHCRGEISDVMSWLELQRAVAQRFDGRMIVVGLRRWKAANMKAMLSLRPGAAVFVKHVSAAAALQPKKTDCLLCWGSQPPAGLEELALASGARLLRMEDGFVRSVGLGSDLIPPQSFVLDSKGIYFDPSKPSELEDILNEHVFTEEDLQRAARVREMIVANGITKYNLEPLKNLQWPIAQDRLVVLVIGQVEDDASIRLGCDRINGVYTNLGLLQAARERYPTAFIVYKPHPDVQSGNRIGTLHKTKTLQFADYIESQASAMSCIDASDVIATMTSLTGFDALLRGKQVDVYGRPFYAGWGLTRDQLPVPRRTRSLSLEELVAGALLYYPLYWDPALKGYTTCEAVLLRIIEERDALARNGKFDQLRAGYVRRQMRKLSALWRSVAPKVSD